MFTTLMKDVDGRRSYRHFKDWHNAEKAMLEDIQRVKELDTICLHESIDKMNVEKGFYDREEILVTNGGIKFHYALLDSYFEDE